MLADAHNYNDAGNVARCGRMLTKVDSVYTGDAMCHGAHALECSLAAGAQRPGVSKPSFPAVWEVAAPALPPVTMIVLPVRDGTTEGFFSLVTVCTAPSTASATFATRLCSEAPAITYRSHRAPMMREYLAQPVLRRFLANTSKYPALN